MKPVQEHRHSDGVTLSLLGGELEGDDLIEEGDVFESLSFNGWCDISLLAVGSKRSVFSEILKFVRPTATVPGAP